MDRKPLKKKTRRQKPTATPERGKPKIRKRTPTTSQERAAMAATGPKSDAGKAVSKMNATKHGLRSDRVVIEALGEKQEDWELHHGLIQSHYGPRSVGEAMMIEQIAQVFWRMRHRITPYRRNTTELAAESAKSRAIQETMRTDRYVSEEEIFMRTHLGESGHLDKADAALDKALNQLEKMHRILAVMRDLHSEEPIDPLIVVVDSKTAVRANEPEADTAPDSISDGDVVDGEATDCPDSK